MDNKAIKTIPLGFLGTNCYIIATDKSNAVVVDPGDDPTPVIAYLEGNNLTACYILLTHGHFDHIGGVNALQANTNATVVIHSEDKDLACDPSVRAAMHRELERVKPLSPDMYVTNGDVIELDNLSIKVKHTPGHSKGSVCYILEDIIFSGDTLFNEGIGRTDLYGGDYTTIIRSLKSLSALDGNYTVYPGHGDSTTLDHERRYNQYLGHDSFEY